MVSKLKRRSFRDDFLFWWPVTARLAGVLGAFAEAGYAIATRQSADAGVLAFCGALVAAPTIFAAQDKRNRPREADPEDESYDPLEGW